MNQIFQLLFSSLCFGILNITSACKTVTSVKADSFPKIEISEGGGFTGAVAAYRIESSGRVFKRETGDSGFVEIRSVSANTARTLIQKVETHFKKNKQINEPDNMYKTLSLLQKDSTLSSVWFNRQPKLDEIYSEIYNAITLENPIKK